jgi:hypothetical protein
VDADVWLEKKDTAGGADEWVAGDWPRHPSMTSANASHVSAARHSGNLFMRNTNSSHARLLIQQCERQRLKKTHAASQAVM